MGTFKSFAGVSSNIQKYTDDKKMGSFAGLKKTSKLTQKWVCDFNKLKRIMI